MAASSTPTPRETTRMSTRKRFGAIIGALAVAGSLAACSGGTPGAAAVVDGREISESEVQTAYQQVGPMLNEQITVATMTSLLVQEPSYTAVGEEFGIAFTDQQLQELYSQTADQLGMDADTELNPSALAILRLSAVGGAINQLSQQQVTTASASLSEKLAAADISMSPRYGTVDEFGAYAPTTYPWIVQTTADVTAG